jgi:hypothetical protein
VNTYLLAERLDSLTLLAARWMILPAGRTAGLPDRTGGPGSQVQHPDGRLGYGANHAQTNA